VGWSHRNGRARFAAALALLFKQLHAYQAAGAGTSFSSSSNSYLRLLPSGGCTALTPSRVEQILGREVGGVVTKDEGNEKGKPR